MAEFEILLTEFPILVFLYCSGLEEYQSTEFISLLTKVYSQYLKFYPHAL